ncbi:DUF3014 domain-containing protein [Hyalangium versicolor]|uniref:DUF3014 domain-containing protein n=1 Tax=Hyalangium versicolor TaxID=2861190 RepID=UPI001CC9DD6D|nr:DUF3014 domain-containing protein [Hyalangium versicolor]
MSEPQPSAPSRKPLFAAIAVILVAAAGIGVYVMRSKQEVPPAASAPTPAPPVATAPTPPAAETDEPPEPGAPPLPKLEQSDSTVRDLLLLLSNDPELQKWLATEGLVRRFTAATFNISEGESPRAVLPFLAPQGTFQVVERDGHTFIAPESFARYDTVTRVLTSLDTKAAARTYRILKPLFRQAFGEIGPPGQTFDQTLARALQRLIDTPVPEGDLEVVDTPGVNYAYAAPELEQLSAAQKHLLRMGPANARALQGKLRELRQALGLPTTSR